MILNTLIMSNLCCHINKYFMSAITNVNEIILLPGSIIQLQDMLESCSKFALKWDLEFTAQTTCCRCIGKLISNIKPELL